MFKRTIFGIVARWLRVRWLAEFDGEVWVLDYRMGGGDDSSRHRVQMQEYRQAMHAGTTCAARWCLRMVRGKP